MAPSSPTSRDASLPSDASAASDATVPSEGPDSPMPGDGPADHDATTALDAGAGSKPLGVPPPPQDGPGDAGDASSTESVNDGGLFADDAGCVAGLRYSGDLSTLPFVGCQADWECMGDGSPSFVPSDSDLTCPQAICLQGRCVETCQTAGYINATLATTTCWVHVCNGEGGAPQVLDPYNMPLHGPCLGLICHPGYGIGNPMPQPVGTPCGTGLACTDAGAGVYPFATACTGCSQPSDCNGIDTPCNQRTCDAGVCGRAFVARGTPCSDAGDLCDGIGWCGLFMPAGGFPQPGFE